jgi:protein-disulfide isomerase/uncharacterized membrane protein
MRRERAPLLIFAIASLAGFAFAAAAAYIHFRLDGSAGYTSFCNINSSVDCDSVLQSRYAQLAGIPIAWLGALAHAALGLIAVAALRREGEGQRVFLRGVVLGAIGSAGFSALMAYLSLSVLETACLMCIGLYAAALTQLAAGLLLARVHDGGAAGSSRLFPSGFLPATAALTFAIVAALGRFAWPANQYRPSVDATLAELRDADPEFFDWYLDQPVSSFGPSSHPSAPVTIVEFSDFECAYCRRNHEYLRELKGRHPGVIAVVHRHFPLDPACNALVDRPLHLRACRAAEAAECARLQDRYADYSQALFENQDRLFEAQLESLAERVGLDVDRFKACMASRETVSRIVADARAGGKLGIKSTPTVYFNGRRISGTLADAGKYDLAIRIEVRLAAGDQLPGRTDIPQNGK